jgi:hypothetical protein
VENKKKIFEKFITKVCKGGIKAIRVAIFFAQKPPVSVAAARHRKSGFSTRYSILP